MFIRIKKIKGKKYAYLVENNWQITEEKWQIVELEPAILPLRLNSDIKQITKSRKKKSSRQKVKQYLGRVYEFEQPKKKYEKKISTDYKTSIKNLIQWHLEQYGFKKQKNNLIKEELKLNLDTLELKNSKTNSDILIKSYEGYIHSHSLKELHDFDGLGYDEEVGKRLAKTLVKAGLNISKESFIQLFEQVFREAR